MSSTSLAPSLILGGGTDGNSATTNISPLSVILQNLMTGAADITSINGMKVLNIGSGAIGTAGPVQVGLTETTAEVAANFACLKEIAAFCTANGIGIEVDASLTNPATDSNGTNALVDQWAPVAAQAGLPIVSLEDVDEVGIAGSPYNFGSIAKTEANAIRTVIEDYQGSHYSLSAGNLAVGDMEGGGASDEYIISDWLLQLDEADAALGLANVSFLTADTSWFAPWIDVLSQPNWQAYLEAMSSFEKSGISLNVVVQGEGADASANQSIQQAEQLAVSLMELQASGSVQVANLAVQTWTMLPIGNGAISSPTSTVNEAAELSAVDPLYLNGSISAVGTATMIAPGQIIINTGSLEAIKSLSVHMALADVLSNLRLGIVIVDQTGTLAAVRSGSGTVSNLADNVLVLTGDAADLAAELASVTLYEANAGPDTIDLETWGTQGRLSDNQIDVVATNGPTGGNVTTTSARQGWLSANDIFNTGTVLSGGSVLTSQTLTWSITGTTATGQSAFVTTVAIHEPLAEYGVENTPASLQGTTQSKVMDIYDTSVDDGAYPSDGYANNPGVNNITFANSGWISGAFNAASELTAFDVSSTVNSFDPTSGDLLTSVDSLAPQSLTVIVHGTTVADTFASAFVNGGTQVAIMNTGGNPAWQAGWGAQFSSATLTYDDAGKLVEMFLQGGPSDSAFSIDNIYDPITGQLWEQFQTASPPPGFGDYANTTDPYEAGFVTGPMYEIQENVSSNPNWDSVDWGSQIPVATEVWTDYFIMAAFAGFAVSMPTLAAGDLDSYPLQFVNGSALDLFGLPGVEVVNLNALGSVTIQSQTMNSELSGLTEVDAWGATGTVTITGLSSGGSTLIGGDGTTTINGYDDDTIVAGAGSTTINTGRGGSTILVTSATGIVAVFGDANTVAAVGGSTVVATGTGDIVTFNAGGVFKQGASSSAVVNGGGVVIAMAATGGTLTAAGAGDTVTGGPNAAITLSGSADIANAGTGSTISVNASGAVVNGSNIVINVGAAASNLTVFGNNDSITVASGQSVSLTGNNESVTGSNLTVHVGANSSGVIYGSNNTVIGAPSVPASGSGNETIFMAADGTNGTAASELIEFVGTKINVQISNGAGVTVEDTLPAAVISSAQLLPTNLVFASSANLSVQATAHPEEFVVQAPVTGPGAAFTIAGFDATQDIVALPYAVFGSAPQILADTLATSGGALIASLNGTSQVLLAGITAGHLGASDFLPI